MARFEKGNQARKQYSAQNKLVQQVNSAAQYLMERTKYRVHEDMATFKIAVDDFENIYMYRREFLHRVFRQLLFDPHLRSQWQTRKMKTLEKQFKVVSATGEENKNLTTLLEKKWFYDLQHHILDSVLWGFSLIEFGPVENNQFVPYMGGDAFKNKMFPAVNAIDRDYVKPEFGIIVHQMGEITGLSFDDPQIKDQVFFCGELHSAGLLMNMAKYILFKDNAIANWSEWAEIFGHDMRLLKSDAQGTERQRALDQLKKIGASGYGLIGLDDEIVFAGTSRADAFEVYNKLIAYIDTQVSKLIFGQDVVTNNTGRVVGKTGENIADMYGTADALMVQRVITDECFPRFTKLGIGNFTGYHLEWDTTEKIKLMDKADVDLKISQMGFKLDPEYIEETYGTILAENQEPESTEPEDPNEIVKAAEKLKNLYQ